MKKIISRNPYSGQIKEQLDFISSSIISKYFQKSEAGFNIQSKRNYKEKSIMIGQIAKLMSQKRQEISKLITFQTGKTIVESERQVNKSINYCKYLSQHFDAFLPTHVKTDARKKTIIKYQPLGLIFTVNSSAEPLFQPIRSTISNLMLGNCVLSRSSTTTPNVSKVLEKLINRAGFESGEYQNIFASEDNFEQIVSHGFTSGVSFMGESELGRTVNSLAGRYLKKSSIFLEGNNALLVLKDANLELATTEIVKGVCISSGQSFNSPKRIIADANIYNEFKIKLIQKLNKIKHGNPESKQTAIGPLSLDENHEKIENQLKTIPKDYSITYKNSQMKKPFYPITLIEGSDQEYDDIVHGPVLFLYKSSSQQNAIKMANSSKKCLLSWVFSSQAGEKTLDKVFCGAGFINSLGTETLNIPYGGVCEGGYGRQGWVEGHRYFSNVKVHYIN